jgi:hypothetical protein
MYKRGFTIFFAVLVASLALAVGLAIYDLLVRELELSQTATQSQYAIYAADTGAECALYWDLNYTDNDGSAFATSTLDDSEATSVICNNQDIAAVAIAAGTWPDPAGTDTDEALTLFTLLLTDGDSSKPCAIVEVKKTSTSQDDPPATKITARGRNTCNFSAPLQLERTLEINY